jgi:hypothetical protein
VSQNFIAVPLWDTSFLSIFVEWSDEEKGAKEKEDRQ